MRSKPKTQFPIYQRVLQFASYVLLGLTAVGALLDAFGNAFALINPLATYIGTAAILVFWVVTAIVLRRHPLKWINRNGREVRVKGLGVKIKLALIGMIVLIWLPRLTDQSLVNSRLQVRIETERDSNLNWANTNRPRDKKLSDLVTISRNGSILTTYDFYNVGKSSRLKNHPATMNLFEQPSPTSVQSFVIDLDQDGNDEVVLKVTNKEHFLHSDDLIACLILDTNGGVAMSAPMPLAISQFEIPMTNPYSAYQMFGEVVNSGGQSWPVSYINYLGFKQENGRTLLLFGWVLDSACYACNHIQQIDAYGYERGQLTRVNDKPMFWTSTYPKEPDKCDFSEFSTDVTQVADFLLENNLPDLKDMMEIFRELRKKNNATPQDSSTASPKQN